MNKYIIVWNVGYGEEADEVEAESLEVAEQIAYEAWREDAEINADFRAIEWNKEDAYNLGLSDEDPYEDDDE